MSFGVEEDPWQSSRRDESAMGVTDIDGVLESTVWMVMSGSRKHKQPFECKWVHCG